MAKYYWKCQICGAEFPHEAYDDDRLDDHAWDHEADHVELRRMLEDGELPFDELEVNDGQQREQEG